MLHYDVFILVVVEYVFAHQFCFAPVGEQHEQHRNKTIQNKKFKTAGPRFIVAGDKALASSGLIAAAGVSDSDLTKENTQPCFVR